MSGIVVTAEQVKLITESAGNVPVRGPEGQIIGFISRDFSEAEVAQVLLRMKDEQRVYTTQQVLDHLRTLER